jgi:hypothetical protein
MRSSWSTAGERHGSDAAGHKGKAHQGYFSDRDMTIDIDSKPSHAKYLYQNSLKDQKAALSGFTQLIMAYRAQ